MADYPLVFADPLVLPLLGLSGQEQSGAGGNALRAPNRPASKGLRAFLVARARFAEDELAAAVQQRAATQYVVLGAGLDTFAYRNPYPELRIFEVDHPATQQWKQALLQEAAIAVPAGVTYVPVDFQSGRLFRLLLAAGFDPACPTVFAWLGVVPYLSRAATEETLHALACSAPGSLLLLDYILPRDALSSVEQLEFDSLAARVAAAGEPFLSSYRPEEIRALLLTAGWQMRDDLGRDEMNSAYFAGRSDELRVLRYGARLLSAERVTGNSR